MRKITWLFLVTALVFGGCTTDSDAPERTIQSGKYVNTAIGLTITFPAAWQIKPDQIFGEIKLDIVALGAPINNFSPNLNVVIEKHSGPISMAEIIPSIYSQLSQRAPDLSNYQDTVYTMNGKEIGEIEYESSNNGNLLHYLQMFFINKGKDVSVTITDRAENFALNQDIKSIKNSILVQ